MTEVISQAQLRQWKKSIKSGGVEAAQQVYDKLYDKGYGYAGWAGGVAGQKHDQELINPSALLQDIHFLRTNFWVAFIFSEA